MQTHDIRQLPRPTARGSILEGYWRGRNSKVAGRAAR